MNLEVRDAWAAEVVDDGVWLHAGPAARTGLCLQLETRPGPLRVSVDVELAHLEPSLPLCIVYKHGSEVAAAAALAGCWAERGGALVLEHGLTLRGAGAPDELGDTRALPEGPLRLRMHLEYAPEPRPRLMVSTDDDVLPPVALDLPAALPVSDDGGPTYVSVWLQEGEVARPPGARETFHEFSKVQVRALELAAPEGVAVPRTTLWTGAAFGWLGRRSVTESAESLLQGFELSPETLGPYSDDVLLLVGLRAAALTPPARSLDLLRQLGAVPVVERSKRSARALWAAERGNVFALTAAERTTLLAWAREALAERGLDDPLTYGLAVVGPNLGEDERPRRGEDDPDDWWLAALCLDLSGGRERYPIETARALSQIGDFERALELFRAVMDDDRHAPTERAAARVYAAFAAYRARRYAEAGELWTDQPLKNPRRRRLRAGLERHLR